MQMASQYSTKTDSELWLDVNDDNLITPLDALIPINYLNRRAAGEGESQLVDYVLFGSRDTAKFDSLFFSYDNYLDDGNPNSLAMDTCTPKRKRQSSATRR